MSIEIALMKDAIMSLNGEIIAVKHDADTDTYLAFGEGGVSIDFDFPVAQAEQQSLLAETNLTSLRAERNAKLAETDWWASSDLTMTAEQTAYRQALRDITDTYSSLDTVVWPTKP